MKLYCPILSLSLFSFLPSALLPANLLPFPTCGLYELYVLKANVFRDMPRDQHLKRPPSSEVEDLPCFLLHFPDDSENCDRMMHSNSERIDVPEKSKLLQVSSVGCFICKHLVEWTSIIHNQSLIN